MEKVTPPEPQSAADYDDRTTAAVKSVLIEVGQITRSLQGKIRRDRRSGSMPAGGTNRVEIAVCSIPALVAMKGHAVRGRYKQKDAYDIYYCIRNYPDGIASLVETCRPLVVYPSARKWLQIHRGKVRWRGATDRHAFASSLSRRQSSAVAHPSNGSRMHSGRSTPGCKRYV